MTSLSRSGPLVPGQRAPAALTAGGPKQVAPTAETSRVLPPLCRDSAGHRPHSRLRYTTSAPGTATTAACGKQGRGDEGQTNCHLPRTVSGLCHTATPSFEGGSICVPDGRVPASTVGRCFPGKRGRPARATSGLCQKLSARCWAAFLLGTLPRTVDKTAWNCSLTSRRRASSDSGALPSHPWSPPGEGAEPEAVGSEGREPWLGTLDALHPGGLTS